MMRKFRDNDLILLASILFLILVSGVFFSHINFRTGNVIFGSEIDWDSSARFASKEIERRAIEVANEIDEYLKNHPNKTLADLQEDSYFQRLAVQQVGKTGYTAITDYESLVCRFHKNSDLVNTNLEELSEKLPGFWGIMSQTRGGLPASGFYSWEEPDGTLTDKYMHIIILKTKTADGVGLSVAATTYVREYELPDTGVNAIFWAIGVILVLVVGIWGLFRKGKLKFERKTLFILFAASILVISTLFVLNTYQISRRIEISAINNFQNQQLFLARQSAEEIKYNLDVIYSDTLSTIRYEGKDLASYNEGEKVIEKSYSRLGQYVGGIYLLDKNGEVILREPGDSYYEDKGVDYSNRPGVKEALMDTNSEEVQISEVFATKSNQWAFSLVFPVKLNSQLSNLIRVNVLIEDILKRSIEPMTFGEGGYSYLYYDNNLYQPRNIERVIFDEEAMKSLEEGRAGSIIGEIKSNKRGVEEAIITYYPFRIGDKYGGVILIASRDEVAKSFSANIFKIWYLTGGIIVSIILVGIIFFSLLTRSLVNEIEFKTRELKEFNNKLEETVKNRTNELQKLNRDLENKVKNRTKELELKSKEYERMNKFMLGRESQMIKLKRQIEEAEDKK